MDKLASTVAYGMSLIIIAISILIVAFAPPVEAQTQQAQCGNYVDITDRFKENHDAYLASTGRGAYEGSIVVAEMWLSRDGNFYWTMLARRADGTACLIAQGDMYTAYDPSPEGEEM